MNEVTHVRIWCDTHRASAINVGTGQILFPTDGSEPKADSEGWMEFDSSEYYCYRGERDDRVCELVFQTKVDYEEVK